MVSDNPLLIRGSSDLVLFTISTAYITSNRLKQNKIADIINESESRQIV